MAKKVPKRVPRPFTNATSTNATPLAGVRAKVGDKKGKGVDEQLRQAVLDLGGDEEDLALIDGIDDDEGGKPAGNTEKGKEVETDEKSLRKALGDFMKGLDFGSAPITEDVQETAGDEDDNTEVEDKEESSSSEGSESEEESSEDTSEDEVEEKIAPTRPPTDAPSNTTKAQSPVPSTAVAPVKTVPSVPKDPNATSGTVVPATPIWTTLLPLLSPLPSPPPPLPAAKLNNLRQRSQHFLTTLPPLNRKSTSSDAAFISQILQSGTHQDKLAALILLVRESPIHAVNELGRLRGMTGWKEDGGVGGGGNKEQRVAVVKGLADWWVSGGGKDGGKLKYFADQPLLAHPDITDRHLLVFAFEDYMKRWFFNILQVLEVLSHDTLPFVRTQALHLVFQLLRGNAEQEQNLLRLGVNKLGDNDKAVASKASHHILQLLQVHPAMKAVVAREVSALILKPAGATTAASSNHVRFDGSSDTKPKVDAKSEGTSHARYYGLITLNQITLTNRDQDVAGKMVELYFEVFREVLGEGKEEKVDGEGDGELGADGVEKVVGKVGKWQGRRKGAKPRGGKKGGEEELIETGEAKLIAAVLTGINRALPYATLDEAVFTKNMDLLFKITHSGTFNTSIQSLNLIFQVAQTRQAVSDRFYRTLYDSLFDTRLLTASKQAMYLNLLFRALKRDDSIARVMAFVKRLLQVLGLFQPPFICGALYLLGELFITTPGLKRMLIEPEDDGEEHFVDAPEASSSKTATPEVPKAAHSKAYDGRKREPQYANADSSCLWELTPFLNHFHPSVQLSATQLLLSQPLTGSSDISLNTLVSFLDRFVYRNPKKTLQPRGASVMQPAAAEDTSGMIVNSRGARMGDDGFVNSEKFWRKKVEDVPVDQLFFHKFFSTKLAQKEAATKKRKGKKGDDSNDDDEVEDHEEEEKQASSVASSEAEDSDAGSEEEDEDKVESEEDSDPEEAEIWRAMKASMPGAEDDMGISDISDDDDDSDDDEVGDDDGDEDEGDEEDEEDDVDSEDVQDDDEEVGSNASMDSEEDVDSSPPPAKSVTKSKVKSKSKSQRTPSPDLSDASEFPDFASEDEALLSLDEMPDIVLNGEESAEEEEEETEEVKIAEGKRKRNDERKERKKKMREMPVFGSYEDYQALIEAGGNDGED